MEYYFVNQHLDGAVQASFLSGKVEYGSNTEVVLKYTLILMQNVAEQTKLRGSLLCQLIKEEFEIISRMMANQNNLSGESVVQLIQDNCMGCAHQLLDVMPDNTLSHTETGKYIGTADDNRDDFRRCCLSLARGVSISEAFDEGPDIDGLMIWLVLGSLYCAMQITGMANRSLH